MNHRSTPPTRRFTVRFTVPAAAICVAAGLSLAATGALAQSQAYTSEPVDLYAGPSDEYPVVSELGPNYPVTVMGCVSDYSWCDVAMPGMRGWVYAGYLTYPYQGDYVPLAGYGAAIGLPIVTFSIGAYWGSFYRDRSWYGERDRWAHVPPPGYGGRPPGPPPQVRGGPHGGAMHGPDGGPPGVPGRPPAPQAGGARGPGAPVNNGAPPPGAGRPPAPGNGEPPQSRAPMNGGERVDAPRPPAMNAPRPPMPQQNNAPRPAAAPPQMQGGGRPAGPGGPPMEHGREGPPQGGGGHAPSQGGGGNHDDRRQPN
ncbi:SH3 domain-containing protein [Paraburkholderia bannensis]|uniref:SH3 domain-containing protein n=1 Tax=Paraburkholderia bannensis TaxID=765414 RepID=UPI002AB7DE2B|nr:SH3 domain-containing protein [Paraburkholderia bannensis]